MRRRDSTGLPLLLAGCATQPEELPPTTPLLAPQLRLALPRPADLGRELQAYQLVTLNHGEQRYAFESHLLLRNGVFAVVLMDSLGRRALRMVWSEQGLAAEPEPWLPKELRPGCVLADIITVHWPADIVRQALRPSGASLEDLPQQRRVLLGGQVIAEATYGFDPALRWSGSLRYTNRAWGYMLEIQSEESRP